MQIAGVPDSVPWETVKAFLASLGIDTHAVTRDGIRFAYGLIECEVYATDEAGHRYIDSGTEKVATHRVSIPITRDD